MTDFEVSVDDNFHYMDEESRYSAGSFASYAEALGKAKAIVDDFLERCYQPGMTSRELFEGYVGFGEDPFIVPSGEPYFSAWDYARERCRILCRDEDAVAAVLRFPVWPVELEGFHAVVLAALTRRDLGTGERTALERFRRSVEDYPDAMPDGNRWYWLRVERGDAAFTVYLYPQRFEFHAEGSLPATARWVLRFRGSGLRDRRDGDADWAFEAMRQAATDVQSALKVKA